MAKRRQKRKKSSSSWGLAAAGFVVGAVVVLLVIKLGGFREPVPPRPAPPIERPPVRPVPPPRPVPPEPGAERPAPPEKYAMVAIVIDDMGQDISKLRKLLEMNAPITVAVLPHLSNSREIAEEAHSNGLDVLLHLPMEPKDAVRHDPGEGALTTSMTAAEVRVMVESDLDSVPYAIGINNHMGSKFTEDAVLMREVLLFTGDRKMFFLDSRTTGKSVAARLSKEMGLRSAVRNIFLDNGRDDDYIKGQIEELVRLARKSGFAVAIGHPYPETIEVLKEIVPTLRESGVELVRLSEIVDRREDAIP